MYEQNSIPSFFPVKFSTHYYDAAWPRSHWHENIEILHIIDGTATASVGINSYDVCKGDTIIVNTSKEHRLFTDDIVKYHCLIIESNFIEQFGLDPSKFSINEKISDKNITSLFEQINNLYMSQEGYYHINVCALTLQVLSIMLQSHSSNDDMYKQKTKLSKAETVKLINNYLQKNLEKDITLDDISNYFRFDKHYLCRIYKDVAQKTITDTLNFFRCCKARNLLLNSNLSISAIAQMCGYKNLSYFTKMYRKYFGYTPSTERAKTAKDIRQRSNT